MRTIWIPGQIRGKARPRVTRKGFAFTPHDTVSYENFVKIYYIEHHSNKPLMKGPVRMVLEIYYDIPKSTSKKNINKMLVGEIKPTKKPDIDNIIKIISDALNKIAYEDDKQIVCVEAAKAYAEKPGVMVKLFENPIINLPIY